MEEIINNISSFLYSWIDPQVIIPSLHPLIPYKKWILGIFVVCLFGGLIGNKIVTIKQITFGGLSKLQRVALFIFGMCFLLTFFMIPPTSSSIRSLEE